MKQTGKEGEVRVWFCRRNEENESIGLAGGGRGAAVGQMKRKTEGSGVEIKTELKP